MSKLSVVVPVYFNEDTLEDMYDDLMVNAINPLVEKYQIEYEIVMVNDGSQDASFDIIKKLKATDSNVVGISLSRNFGSHSSISCGIEQSTGDCIAVKSADLQESSQLVVDMFEKWQEGNKVVLATREARDDAAGFSNLFYWITRRFILKNMPESGFDAFLLDRVVAKNIETFDITNSTLTGKILWSGFKTATVGYHRLDRTVGESKWTLKKKLKQVSDMIYSFSNLPIFFVQIIGVLSVLIGAVWAVVLVVSKIMGSIQEVGWTSLFIFNLLSFGTIMITLSVLGGYLWRSFEASRNRPAYMIEEVV
ncbi:glycosyl transferase [Actinomycetota bacterium]|nr:glycosyl transferase [Actinomycetota bacterium]